tara:strand:- start:572 stop:754 length:183 start_codon:yes stop_codon:yes gene_type:complete
MKHGMTRIFDNEGNILCRMCNIKLTTNNCKGKLYYDKEASICGKCYLQWKREVRKQKGES